MTEIDSTPVRQIEKWAFYGFARAGLPEDPWPSPLRFLRSLRILQAYRALPRALSVIEVAQISDRLQEIKAKVPIYRPNRALEYLAGAACFYSDIETYDSVHSHVAGRTEADGSYGPNDARTLQWLEQLSPAAQLMAESGKARAASTLAI